MSFTLLSNYAHNVRWSRCNANMWQMNAKRVLSGSLRLLKRFGVSQLSSDLVLRTELCGFFFLSSQIWQRTQIKEFFYFFLTMCCCRAKQLTGLMNEDGEGNKCGCAFEDFPRFLSLSLSLNSLQTEHKLMIQTAIDSQIAQLKSDFNVTTNGELGKWNVKHLGIGINRMSDCLARFWVKHFFSRDFGGTCTPVCTTMKHT